MFESFSKKEATPKSFEEQWENPELTVLSGEAVNVYDINPEKTKDPVPVWIAPGWTGTPEMYRENIRTLYEKDRRVVAVDSPHGIDFNRAEMPDADFEKMPDAILRKVAAMINTFEAKGIKNVDAVGHSEGCLDLVLAATLYPEYFRDLVLVNPAGMIGKDTLPRLMVGFTADIVKGYIEEVRTRGLSEPLLRASRVMMGSIVASPVQAFKEVLAIADADLPDMVLNLRKQGIGIIMVSAVDDEAFPGDRMQQNIKKEHVDGFYAVAGKHNQFIVEAPHYTLIADSAFDARERKRRCAAGEKAACEE
ncbi:MAG: alpha/beta hydrolase [Candidatus Pacebacteria bacterium]|jgi:pimeloyl-ACP methyl ester carboxylesterase|nr:alpha/beta hydrolase [Candidatus Paceibacterota bacterium]